MANDARSGRRNNHDEGNSSKQKSVDVKGSSTQTGSPDSRTSAQETSCSPLSTRKSERLEKRTPVIPLKRMSATLVTPLKRESETQNSPSSLRRSERGKKDASSSSPESKHPMTGSKSSDVNKKKVQREKSLNRLIVESAKVDIGSKHDQESVVMKRKFRDARSYKALFSSQARRDTSCSYKSLRAQQRRDTSPDIADKSEKMDVLSEAECQVSEGGTSKQMDLQSQRLEDTAPTYDDKDTSDKSERMHVLLEVECSLSQGGASKQMDMQSKSLEHTASAYDDKDIADESVRVYVLSEDECGVSQGGASKQMDLQSQSLEHTPPTYDKNDIADKSERTDVLSEVECGVSQGGASKQTDIQSQKDHVISGTCGECSKIRRVKDDSPNQDLCSCTFDANKDLDVNSCQKGGGHLETTIMPESVERLESSVQLDRTSAGVQLDARKRVCVICNQDEELLFCDGKGCENCYHLSCLDPPLEDFPPGFWHCIWCVKKKVELGVHSVSKGVESIWDSREVEVSGSKVQKQYFVKYQGLGHIHNQWVPETVLLTEVPHLVDKFNREQQCLRWNSEWTVPHRLLKKRMFPKWKEHCDGSIMHCQFECLIKWRDLGYEHATWELEDAQRSSSSEKLLSEFDIRREKAKRVVDKSHKGLYVKLTKLPYGGSSITDSNLLNNVNRLREFWFKHQNAVVLDDQDRVMSAVLFILSLSEIGCPFLVIATSEALSLWEDEFRRLAPSIDLVVYAGNKETRRSIRALEFYEEGGQMMLQVLLSSLEAVSDDLHILRQISWGAILIDECHSRICTNFANSRVVLFASQLKDTAADYHSMLSLLDSRELSKTGRLKCDGLDSLKEKLARFTAYGCKSESTKFAEYWVPVQISNLQLEQYCATLLSNSMSLRSCSKQDSIGALRDILCSVRQCCDHPFIVDLDLRVSIIKGLPLSESWGVEIKASGKLHCLDMILKEIKARQLRALILFQSIGGAMSTGDLLDDFVRQNFGQDCYERVDVCMVPSKKQASLNRFNTKESAKFIFLLENRACFPSIKLSSVDTVVIFDSDWHPANDLKALQKISIDSQVQPIKVFRLYSACTFEENVLMHAKQNLKLENNPQNITRTSIDTLLKWGASYLFTRLDQFHARSNQASPADISSGESLANDVVKEFLAILTGDLENKDADNSVISKAQQCLGVYDTNCPLLGERQIQLTVGEEPHIFWRNLLEGRSPQWRYACCPTPRNRKRVQYFDGSSRKPETENDDGEKKRRKVVNSGADPSSIQTEPTAGTPQVTPVNLSLPASTTCGNKKSSLNHAPKFNSHGTSLLPEVNPDEPGERLISNEQKSLYIFLKREMAKLCEVLALREDVKNMVGRFLDYVIDNHRVISEHANILHALQMSMCWSAASMLKQKMDKKVTLMLAKQRLNFECTEELADFVYLRIRELKKNFVQQPEIISFLHTLNCSRSAEEYVIKESSDARSLNQETVILGNVKSEKEVVSDILEGISQNQGPAYRGVLSMQEHVTEEIQEVQRMWEDKKLQLEKQRQLEIAVIRSMYKDSVRMSKLKFLDDKFAIKFKELEQLKEARLRDLKPKQSAESNEERENAAKRLADSPQAASGEATCTNDAGENEAVVQTNDEVEREDITDSNMPDYLGNQIDKAESAMISIVPSTEQSFSKTPLVEAISTTDNGISVPSSHTSLSEVPQIVMSTEAQDVECQPFQDGDPGCLMSNDMQDLDQMDTANQNIAEAGVVPPAVADAGPTTQSYYEASCERLEPVAANSSQPLQDEGPGCLMSTEMQDVDQIDRANQNIVEAEVVVSTVAGAGPTSQSNYEASCERLEPVAANSSQPLQDEVPGCLMSTEMQDVDQIDTANQIVAEPEVVPSTVADAGPTAQSNYEANSERPEPVAANSSLGCFQSQTRQHLQTDLCNSSVSLNADPLQNELERLRKETDQAIKGHEDTKLQLRSDCQREIEEVVAHVRKKYAAKLQDVEAVFLHKKDELDTTLKKVFLNKILADAVRSKCLDLRPSGLPGKHQVMPSSFMQQMQQLSSQSSVRTSSGAGLSSAAHAPALATQQNLTSTAPPGHRSSATGSSSASHPPATQQNTTSALPPGHRSFATGSSSASHLPATQQNTTSTVPAGHRSAALSPGVGPGRPPLISAITPSTANTRVGGEMRAPAPHLQPFRPSGSVSAATNLVSLPRSLPNQHVLPPSTPSLSQPPPTQLSERFTPVSIPATGLESLPQSMPSQVVLTPSTPSPSHFSPKQLSEGPSRLSSQPAPLLTPHSQANQSGPNISAGLSASQSTHLSAMELLMDINRQSAARGNIILPPLADDGLNVNSVNQSEFGTVGREQNSLRSSAPSSDVVCLSDDE